MDAILVEYWPCCHQLSHWDLAHVVDQPGHYRAQDSSKRCSECQWETWTKWNLFMRKRNEVFRYTPSKETTTIWVKQAALKLVDRLARDVPQPARKEGLHQGRNHAQRHSRCSYLPVHKHGGIGEHLEVVGRQIPEFVVASWLLLNWNESIFVCW